ncbi:C-type lectin domain family 10 member A-like isoform X1 [Mercenaria mercenaria]|uniref:C-type lectin domain family 10 member A-like isoform X1 n=1 Tax=Mercenaria mercenaria TaxID=6596 RepID=UPI00234F88CE|nr:C-type lectin domain family 10 member A-like isoform X1 [Mercenaria mercenaria]
MAATVYLFQICFFLCLSAFAESSCCSDRWTAFQGSCYLFAHGGKLSFYEAEHYCNQHGGNLVHIDNEAENLFIKDYLRSIKADHTWIGLTDEGSEGLWEWYDTHTSPSFTDSYPGEPNALEGDEDCVCVDAWHDYRWFGHLCSLQKAPLCESTGYVSIVG